MNKFIQSKINYIKFFLHDKDFRKKEILGFLKETVNTLLFVITAVIIIRFFIGELRWIPSGSMIPTLVENDKLFVDRMSRFFREPKRGDILVFYPPEEVLKNDVWHVFARLTGIFCKDVAYIKRVVGMPGDMFEIRQDMHGYNWVYINGEQLDEKYIISRTGWIECDENKFCGPFRIPPNHYFMMGDNRPNSADSRIWGFLPKDRIIGRAVLLFWPLNRINLLTNSSK